MIDIDAVTKRYGDTAVVDRVSLRIPPGGVVSLIGPNGAGKSTLLSIIGRLLDADEGRVAVDELDVATTPGPVLARRLSILRQENHLPIRLTVRELVEFGRHPHCQGRLRDADRAHVESAIAHLELAPFAARRLDQLSGGQRQRAHIAMVLAQDTDYVLLDEPLNNLDMRHAAQSMDVIRRLADQFGKTVVVVLHDVNVAAHHSDRIVAMRDGRILADGAPHDIVDRHVLRDVYDLDVPVTHVDRQPIAMHFARTPRSLPVAEPRPLEGHHDHRRHDTRPVAGARPTPAADAHAVGAGGGPADATPGADRAGWRRPRRLRQRGAR